MSACMPVAFVVSISRSPAHHALICTATCYATLFSALLCYDRYVGRRAAAATATGLYRVHASEQSELLDEALLSTPPPS